MTPKKLKNEPPRFFEVLTGRVGERCDGGTIDDLASGELTISGVASLEFGKGPRSDELRDVGAVDTVANEKLVDTGLTGLIESESGRFSPSDDLVLYCSFGI